MLAKRDVNKFFYRALPRAPLIFVESLMPFEYEGVKMA